MMNRRLKITGIVLFLLLAVAGLIVWKYDFPKKIKLTYPAVEFRPGHPSLVDKTTITIKGTLHRRLFHDERFTGHIEIAKYDVTKSRMAPIIFQKDTLGGWGNLAYFVYAFKPSGAVKKLDIVQLSSIWKTGKFENVKLQLYERVEADLGSGKYIQIMAPATDYDSALALEQQYKDRDQY